jgi:hypothetical protein
MIESVVGSPQQHNAGSCEHGGGGSGHAPAQSFTGAIERGMLASTRPAKAANNTRRIEDLTNMLCSG